MLYTRTQDQERVLEKGGLSLFRTRNFAGPALLVEGTDPQGLIAFVDRIIAAMQLVLRLTDEPLLNLFCLYSEARWRVIIFPRRRHRPLAYEKTGDEQIMLSPGAVDMAGLVVVPRKKDFDRLDAPALRNIFREVSLPEDIIDQIVSAV